jgi:hypothetical protein
MAKAEWAPRRRAIDKRVLTFREAPSRGMDHRGRCALESRNSWQVEIETGGGIENTPDDDDDVVGFSPSTIH